MEIERRLQAFGSVPFSHGALLPMLSSYRRPNDKIAAWLASGDLMQLRRGLYVLGSRHRNAALSLPVVANVLFGPSYVSLDFALGWHALIPEDVVEITSVTTRRTCQYDTTIGRFSYTHLSADWYGIGVRMLQNPEGLSFLIASPEKALCDKVLLTRKLQTLGVASMRTYLLEDLRLDPDAFSAFDLGLFEQCLATGHKPQQLTALCRVVRDMR